MNNGTDKTVIKIEDTSIREYLETIRKEYEIERNKRTSFEGRAGILITIIAALVIFVFEKIKINEIISLIERPLNFIILLKILSGVLIYTSFVYALVMTIKTINIKIFHNFEVKNINETVFGRKPIDGLGALIKTYRDIIIQHRDINEKNAKSLKRALYSILITIVSVILYINL